MFIFIIQEIGIIYNKTNYILVENEPTREINLNIVFQSFQQIKLYHYSNVNFLELIKRIAKLNLIMQNHARHIHDHETDVRRIYDHVAHSSFFVLFW